ncbi:MAG: hypothetical protein HY905_27380 [Deltaproteobacteria bacterium]|nr:hypothetical protein [Deltaproteobacteria bacterium]
MLIVERAVLALRGRIGSHVRDLAWDGTTLVVTGDGWRVRALCSWRLMRRGTLTVGSDDKESGRGIEALRGTELVDVRTAEIPVDPVLIFSEGVRLEIFSSSSFEPWVIHVDGHPVVFVASPSDPAAGAGPAIE